MDPEVLDGIISRIDELFEESGYALDSTQAELIRYAIEDTRLF
jgi:hypothetical protein